VQWPLLLKFSELLVKLSINEKLTEKELQEISELQKKINILMKGGSVGSPREKKSVQNNQQQY
jgi:hypothetical protein